MSSTRVFQPVGEPGEAPPVPTPAAAALVAAVDALGARRSNDLADVDLAGDLLTIRAQIGRLEAISAERLAAVDRRGIAAQAGATSTQAWYRYAGDLHPVDASRQVRHARALEADLPRLRQAGVDGAVSWAKLRVAAGQAAATPEHLMGLIEPTLLAAAGELGLGSFERVCRQARARAEALLGDDPDRRAYEQRYLRVSPVGDLVRLDGQLDRADGQVLLTALEALSNPATTPTGPRTGEAGDAGRDLRTAGQRRADALVWLAGHALNTAELPSAAGHRPHLNVLVDLETLQAEARRVLDPAQAGGSLWEPLDTTGLSVAEIWNRRVDRAAALLPAIAAKLAADAVGAVGAAGVAGARRASRPPAPLPPAELLRVACDATLRRIVTAAADPIDVGRATRSIPAGLRAALHARDGGCIHPGCDRPPSWCEVHHLIHYLHGGPTDLRHTALVCGHHHRWAHKTGRTYARAPDRRWRIVPYEQALREWQRTGVPPVRGG
jgi:hypothetical protein